MFGSTSAFSTTASTNNNAMKYVEVKSPPDDSVSCIKFSPTSTGTSSFLIAGSWDTNHDAPIKTVHWIKAPNYSCIMTGGWDKLLKFWDTRSPTPMDTIQLPERCYCADVMTLSGGHLG